MKKLLAIVLLLAACARPVTRSQWQQMPQSEKTIYVKSLLGGERARAAKGGEARHYSKPATEYVKRIDAAYAHGAHDTPEAIFARLQD